MIHFFSSIRKQLAAQNKVAAYIRYAIGEIVLVVIGILIALQVNNWNEARIEQKQEGYFIKRLTEDFESNKMVADETIRFENFQVEGAKILLNSLEETPPENLQDDWLYALTHLWFLPYPNYTENTWQELNTTGKVALIQNKEIVKSIGAYYALMNRTFQLEDEWGQFNFNYRQKVNEILEDSLRLEVLKAISFTEVTNPIKNPPDISPFLDKFRATEGIMGIVSDIKLNRTTGAGIHLNIKYQTEAILSALKQEDMKINDQ